MTHGRGQMQHVELGLTNDGTIVGMKGRGHRRRRRLPVDRRVPPVPHPQMAPGVYAIPKVELKAFATRPPTRRRPRAYRGAGRPEATQLLERIVDIGGRRARHRPGRDPQAELHPARGVPARDRHRRELRHRRVRQGARRGVPRRGLRRAARRAGGAARARRPHAARHRRVGLRRGHRGRAVPGVRHGRDQGDGGVDVTVGTSAHGQGHETAFAMIVHELLGVPMEKREARAVRHRARAPGRGHDGIALAADRRQRASTTRARRCSRRPSASPRTCSRPTSTTS